MVIAGLLALALASDAREDTLARLQQALARELQAGEVELVSEWTYLVVRLKAPGGGDPAREKDATWKLLGAIAREAKQPGAPTLHVEVTGADQQTCLRREQGAVDYLFKKQQVTIGRAIVRPCALPASAQLGALQVSLPKITINEYASLTAVRVGLTNGGDTTVAVRFKGVELVPLPRAVALTGVQVFGADGGVAPAPPKSPVVVPPRAAVTVMLNFTETREHFAWEGRVTLETTDGQATLSTGVTRYHFHEGLVDGKAQ